MHLKSTWSYINKGLLIILSILVVSSLASIIFLTQTLRGLHALTQQSGNAVGTTFVLQDLLINLQEVQTSVRGYVLTGNKAYLIRYAQAKEAIPADIRILNTNEDLILSEADRKRVQSLTDQKLEVMERTIKLRDTEGFEAAQSMIASGEGEGILQDIRKEITDLSSKSLQNIGPMQQKSEDNTRRAIAVAAAMALFVLSTCGAVIWYFKRAILHERALESTKNEFLSLASHQLRTPATNVKQYIGLLLDGYMGDLSDQQRHALDVAYRNNELEISIMNNLLDVAKLDLDRIQLHKKVTNIMKTARHVVDDYKAIAAEKKMTVTLKGNKQVMALADEQYIKGVIENLVDNAIKYSRDGTTIAVSIVREEDEVCIAVKDRGLGIRKRDMNKLFNKFSRLTNEFSANSEGSGLGLYWVKQVVQLHGGTVEVVSKEGKGSTFTVKLPVR
jgi:signal transduction histidine kinase